MNDSGALPGWLPPLIQDCLVGLEVQPALTSLYSIIHAFGQLLRFLTIAQICDYLIDPDNRTAQADAALALLRRPSMGHWVSVLNVLTSTMEKRGQDLFLPELKSALRALQKEQCDIRLLEGQKLRRVRLAPMDAMLRMRNALAHGALPPRDADAASLRDDTLAMLLCVLEHLTVIGDIRTLRVIRRDATEAIVARLETDGTSVLESRSPNDLIAGTLLLERASRPGKQLRADLLLLNDSETFEEAMLAFDGVSSTRAIYIGARQRVELRDQVTPLRERLFAPSISMRWTVAPGLLSAAATTTTTIGTLRGTKYSAETFQPRPQFRALVDDLLDPAVAQRGVILTGESGVGKTALLCDLAIALMQDTGLAVLPVFLTASSLHGGADLLSAISDAFGVARHQDAASLLKAVEEACDRKLAGDQAPRILLLVDGLNEFPDAERALLQFDELVQVGCRGPWLRCLASVRRGSLDLMAARLPKDWLGNPRAYLGGGQAEGELPVVTLPGFSEDEAELSWQRYRAASAAEGVLQPIAPFATLPAPVRDLVRHPLLMRLVVRTFVGRAIPPSLTGSTLFKDYHDTVLNDGQRAVVEGVAVVFARVAKRYLADEEIEEGLAIDDWAEQSGQLFEQGILVEGDDGVTFTHQLYLEYLLERDLCAREMTFSGILAHLASMVERRVRFIEEELNAARNALFAYRDGSADGLQAIREVLRIDGFAETIMPFVARLRAEDRDFYSALLAPDHYADLKSLESLLKVISTIGDTRGQVPLLEALAERHAGSSRLRWTLRLARVHLRLGQLTQARIYVEKAEHQAENDEQRVRFLAESGYQTVFTGGSGALELYGEALALLDANPTETTVNLTLRRTLLAGRGCAFHNLDQAPECLLDHMEALAVSRSLSDRETEAIDLVNVADALWANGELGPALSLYQEALDVASAAWFDDARDVALVGRGTVLWSIGQFDAAMSSVNEGIGLASRLEQPWDESWGLVYRGAILASSGRAAEAVVATLEARRIALKVKSTYLTLLCDAYLGWALELASPGASPGSTALELRASESRNMGLRGPAAILESVSLLASIEGSLEPDRVNREAVVLARRMANEAPWKGSWEFLAASICSRFRAVYDQEIDPEFVGVLDRMIAAKRANIAPGSVHYHERAVRELLQ